MLESATKTARSLMLALVFWLASTASLWAQATAEEPEEKSYVPSYMIIIFAVGLGLLIICRSGKRTTSFRRN